MERDQETNQEIIKKGPWKPEEDLLLKKYIETHGEGKWTTVSKRSGLMRGAKSCRMRWKNHLRPNIKRGQISEDEEDLIIRMHKLLGNRWSLIAGRLPGRTDNEVKNYWNTHISKRNLHQCQTRDSSDCNKNKIRRLSNTMDRHSTSTGTTTRKETIINNGSDEVEGVIQSTFDDDHTKPITSNPNTRNNSNNDDNDDNDTVHGSDEVEGAHVSLDTQPTSTESNHDNIIINHRSDEGQCNSVLQSSTLFPDFQLEDTNRRREDDEMLSWWMSDESTFYVPFMPSTTLDFSVLSFESFDEHSSDECWNNKHLSWF